MANGGFVEPDTAIGELPQPTQNNATCSAKREWLKVQSLRQPVVVKNVA
jgi:hypothetical protein